MKKLLLGSTPLFRDFGRDDKGSTALTFGLGLTVMLLAMGAGIDFAMASKKQAQAQALADQIGLAAAIYIKNNRSGLSPQTDAEGYRDDVRYLASDLGNNNFKIGEYDATVTVDYRVEDAQVTVEGKIPTTFMAVGGVTSTDYSATSVVKYEKIGLRASSVMLVLDNSGSMGWHDTPSEKKPNGNYRPPKGSRKRIAGLKRATRSLMNEIKSLKGQVDVAEYIRTGMVPFASDIIDDKRVWMKWGPLTHAQINEMQPDGATNSAPPMAAALSELRDEAEAHKTKGNEDPLKFVVFMTDGVNTVYDSINWTPEPNTTLWRSLVCSDQDWGCDYAYTVNENGAPSRTGYENRDWFVSAGPWEEGKLRTNTDDDTLGDCQDLKNEGVFVYAVGFATRTGWYWDPENKRNRPISPVSSERIHSFLQECSSGPGYFMTADESDSLNSVFRQIGQTIHQRSIYVSR